MAIFPTATIGASQPSELTSGSDVIDKDEFMQLLITQLQHQDPLNPMDNSEFTSQMAQFASLEQLQNINSNLDSLKLYQSALFNENMASFIGNTVKAVDNTIGLSNGVPDELKFELDNAASEIHISIYDSSDSLVKNISTTGDYSAGEQILQWDGTDNGGNPAPDGSYSYIIQAVRPDGYNFNGIPFYEGPVDSVHYSEEGTAYLSSGGRSISAGSVIMVSGG